MREAGVDRRQVRRPNPSRRTRPARDSAVRRRSRSRCCRRADTCGPSFRTSARCRRPRPTTAHRGCATRARVRSMRVPGRVRRGVPAEPPRTVKSPAVTISLRPSTRHVPSTSGFGVNAGEFVAVVLRVAGQPHEFAKAVAIGKRVDAFAHRQLAARTLSRDALRSAHLFGELFAPCQFVDLVLPAHCRLPSVGCGRCYHPVGAWLRGED